MKVRSGFTLVELLIVIAVIAILAAVAFVAIDPATRINEAQDSERWSAVNALMDAFLEYTVDNNGTYPGFDVVPDPTANAADDVVHMITNSAGGTCRPDGTISGCPDTVDTCTTLQTELVTGGYIAALPLDPDGNATYGYESGGTGYTLNVDNNGIITIKSCGAELDTIQVSR